MPIIFLFMLHIRGFISTRLTSDEIMFQIGILASYAITLQNFIAFAVQMLYVEAALMLLSLPLLEGRKDSATTA
jgi:hypothetical protein